MSDVIALKPRRGPFMMPRIIGGVVGLTLLSGAVAVAAVAIPAWSLLVAVPVMWIVLLGPLVYGAHVAYTKERYEIHPDHLVGHHGGILSDGRNELDIRNITHVRLRLPWLRHRFFGIGDVRVESAGSAASEITFRAIDDPEGIYAHIQELMRNRGFSLQRGQKLHEESPTVVGALTDIVQTGLAVVFGLVWIGFALVGAGAGVAQTGGALAAALVSTIGVGMGLGSVALAVFGATVRYLDLTRRTYTVYDDTVEYTEGFLTRDNAFIPFENIADASIKRTAIDQLLGLYDVTVSCQGSGSEIRFRRLSNGPALTEAIRTLVARARTRSRRPDPPPGEVDDAASADASPGRKRRMPGSPILVDPSEAWTAELRMDLLRAIAPTLVILPALPLWFIAAIGAVIRATRTAYTVGTDTLSSSFSFIGAQQTQFAYDKVTGVQITRTPLDAPFGTMTVQVWSIGAPQPLTLAHIRERDVDLPALLRQCGIPADTEARGELQQRFGPRVWLIQNAGVLLMLAGAILSLVIAAALVNPFLLLLVPVLALLPVPAAIASAWRVRRQRITFHDDHLEARTGIVFRRHTMARYDNIKKVETVAIPFTDQGRLKVYVAGERVVQNQGQQAQGANGGLKIPYTIQGAYIEGISTKVDAMDALLLGLIEPEDILGEHRQDDDVITTTRPAVLNAVVPLVIVGLVVWPLLALVPITAWQIKVRRYDVETDRVVLRGGILFKQVVSVLFNRIDSIQQRQGALGKAFGNGSVILLTAGSSMPDFVVANVPDYTEIYAIIRKHYGSGDDA